MAVATPVVSVSSVRFAPVRPFRIIRACLLDLAIVFRVVRAFFAVGPEAGAALGPYAHSVAYFDPILDLAADANGCADDFVPDTDGVEHGTPAGP